MNGTAEQVHGGEFIGAGVKHRRIATGGSMVEGISSVAAIILAIIGLAHVFPADLAAVAVIGIGISLVFEGGTVGARFSRLLAAGPERAADFSDLGGGMTTEFMAGAAGVVLGLLALLNVVASVLVPVAVLVFGTALLLSSGVAGRLSYLEITVGRQQEGFDAVASEAISATSGAQVLGGLAAVVLGILALVGINGANAEVLTLVAVLSVATAILVSGTAIGGRILRVLE